MKDYLKKVGVTDEKIKEIFEYVESVLFYEEEFFQKSKADKKLKNKDPKKVSNDDLGEGHWVTLGNGNHVFIGNKKSDVF